MKSYGEPKEGFAEGGHRRRRRGGTARGMIAPARLDQRSRRAANGAPASKDLSAPAGDQGAPLPEAPQATRPSTPLSVDDDNSGVGMKRGGHITAAQRRELPTSEFGLPGHGTGPEGKGSGSYPIDTPGRARSALSRASANASPAEQATIRRKVHARYPSIGEG